MSYKLRKFVRRNKRTVLAASLVVLALVGGIIGTTWGMLRDRCGGGAGCEQRGDQGRTKANQ